MDKKLLTFDGEFWDEAVELTDSLVEAGADESKALDAVAEFLDAIVPMDVLIPGPAGVIAESVDGPLIRKGVEDIYDLLKRLFSVDPEKKDERKAKRASRRAVRLQRRADRRSDKEG